MAMAWSLNGYVFPIIPSDYRKPIVELGDRYARTSRGSLLETRRYDDIRTIEAYILQWEAMPYGMYAKLRDMYKEGKQYILTTDVADDRALVYFTKDGWQLEQRVNGLDIWYEGIITLEVV